MSLQILKRAIISYVTNSAKVIWSVVAHPLTILSTKECDVADYRIYGSDEPIGTDDGTGQYVIPITIRGKNYFDLNKVPFETNTTEPYNNGLKAEKTSASNRGDKIPVSLPLNKEITMTMEVVDSKIEGSAARVTMGFYNKSGSLVRSTNVTATKAKKSYTFTLTAEVKYIQFYFQSANDKNAVGDYITMDNIMLRTEGDSTYEHYITPQTIDISLGEPIGAGEVIQKSVDGLPNLPQYNGTTTYEVLTDTPPSGIEVCYYG